MNTRTVVKQHPADPASGARRRGASGLGALALAAVTLLIARRRQTRRRGRERDRADAVRRRVRAARDVNAGAATLALSVLTDSALAHYRGGFHNPAMYAAPTAASLTFLAATATAAARSSARRSTMRDLVFGCAALVGLAGLAFHIRNVSRRVGGWRWVNVFHGAPIAAPLALHVSGLLGLLAARVPADATIARTRFGRALAALASLGMIGTSGEAGLLHFRGAFHDPFMYLPVTVPPAAAAMLALAASVNTTDRRRQARTLLRATAALGALGVAFHGYGVHRRMGGWRNWSQNILTGPPIPAPPAFAGLALVGLGALELLDTNRNR
jgi:hypothetical protein